MTSPRPPRLRDTRSLVDRVRQDRQNLQQLGVGFVGGRFPPARPLGSAAYIGDIEDDEAPDDNTNQIAFWDADEAIAVDTGPVSFDLTYTPIPGSLHVRQNGLDLAPSEWSLAGKTLTITPSASVVIRAPDQFTTAYAYYPTDEIVEPAADITFLGYSPGTTNAWLIPAEAVEGCLLVAVGMVAEEKTVTPNGWTFVGESPTVTHQGDSAGFYTYRLMVLTTIYDGTATVPTLPGGTPQSQCLMAAFSGGTVVDEVNFSTLADGTSASTPAITPSSLRAWGTIGNHITITPSQGLPAGSISGVDISAAMTQDDDTGPVSASANATAGWCLASMVVR